MLKSQLVRSQLASRLKRRKKNSIEKEFKTNMIVLSSILRFESTRFDSLFIWV